LALPHAVRARSDAKELEVGKSLVGSDGVGWDAYCHVLLCANEFMYVD
jgi:hypothetical protein